MPDVEKLYPSLINAIETKGLTNAIAILEAMSANFSTLFDLKTLEELNVTNKTEGSYYKFFDALLYTLKDIKPKFTADEVTLDIYKQLNLRSNATILTSTLDKYMILNPKGSTELSPQPAFHEKLATGTLSYGESVTYMDMLRLVDRYKSYNFKTQWHDRYDYGVYQLASFPKIPTEETKEAVKNLLKNKQFLIINVNADLSRTPKWAVIDARNTNESMVYCETPLTEGEKKAMVTKLGINAFSESKKYDFKPMVTSEYDVEKNTLYIECENERNGFTDLNRTCGLIQLDEDLSEEEDSKDKIQPLYQCATIKTETEPTLETIRAIATDNGKKNNAVILYEIPGDKQAHTYKKPEPKLQQLFFYDALKDTLTPFTEGEEKKQNSFNDIKEILSKITKTGLDSALDISYNTDSKNKLAKQTKYFAAEKEDLLIKDKKGQIFFWDERKASLKKLPTKPLDGLFNDLPPNTLKAVENSVFQETIIKPHLSRPVNYGSTKQEKGNYLLETPYGKPPSLKYRGEAYNDEEQVSIINKTAFTKLQKNKPQTLACKDMPSLFQHRIISYKVKNSAGEIQESTISPIDIKGFNGVGFVDLDKNDITLNFNSMKQFIMKQHAVIRFQKKLYVVDVNQEYVEELIADENNQELLEHITKKMESLTEKNSWHLALPEETNWVQQLAPSLSIHSVKYPASMEELKPFHNAILEVTQSRGHTLGKSTSAESLASTGFAALAWLDQEALEGRLFDRSGDFDKIFSSYCNLQFAGSNPTESKKFHFTNNELEALCPDYIQRLVGNTIHKTSELNKTWNYYPFSFLGNLLTSPTIEGEAYPSKDPNEALKLLDKYQIDEFAFKGAHLHLVDKYPSDLSNYKNSFVINKEKQTLNYITKDGKDIPFTLKNPYTGRVLVAMKDMPKEPNSDKEFKRRLLNAFPKTVAHAYIFHGDVLYRFDPVFMSIEKVDWKNKLASNMNKFKEMFNNISEVTLDTIAEKTPAPLGQLQISKLQELVNYYSEESQDINAFNEALADIREGKAVGSVCIEKDKQWCVTHRELRKLFNSYRVREVPEKEISLSFIDHEISRTNISWCDQFLTAKKDYNSYQKTTVEMDNQESAVTVTIDGNFKFKPLETFAKNLGKDESPVTLFQRDPSKSLFSNFDFSNDEQDQIGAGILLNFFRLYAHSRKIGINDKNNNGFGTYVTPSEQQQIISILQQNAFLTELNFLSEHKDRPLNYIQDIIQPIVSRNKWLQTKGYNPPLKDDFWKKAARFWLFDLNDCQDLLSANKTHNDFKSCVMGMGEQGLEATLAVLADEFQSKPILAAYGSKQPAFYAAFNSPDQWGSLNWAKDRVGPLSEKALQNLNLTHDLVIVYRDCYDDHQKQDKKSYYYWDNDKQSLTRINVDPKVMANSGLESNLSFEASIRSWKVKDKSAQNILSLFSNKSLYEGAKRYLRTLRGHIDNNHPFPFSKLGIAYLPETQDEILLLLASVNQKSVIKEVVFTEGLKNPQQIQQFLGKLMEEAVKNRWQTVISVPELESLDNPSLLNQYKLLNNIILQNRATQAGALLLPTLLKAGESKSELEKTTSKKTVAPTIEIPALPSKQRENNRVYPLKRGGSAQLQFQQQQQIAAQRQLQLKSEKRVIRATDDRIISEYVTYDNIHEKLSKLLGGYDKAARLRLESKAILRNKEGESLMQGLFHTWINANPKVHAKEVIYGMTEPAVRKLLLAAQHLTSGLSLDNLPKGFYTQRSKDDQLILCYDPERSQEYSETQNRLTVNLDVHKAPESKWEGDFRLLNLPRYAEGKMPDKPEKADIELIILFEKLQPELADADRKLIEKFKDEHSNTSEQINSHWLVLTQLDICFPKNGISVFNTLKNEDFTLDNKRAVELLLPRASKELQEFACSLVDADPKCLRAMGQVYKEYGQGSTNQNESTDCLSALLSSLQKLQQADSPFFEAFFKNVLSKSNNFCEFLTPEFFDIIQNGMIKRFSDKNPDANVEKALWHAFCNNHLDVVEWQDVPAMWNAFCYFIDRVKLDVPLDEHLFDKLSKQNMFVTCDRVLEALKKLPEKEQKKRLLASLATSNWTHGGVFYAVRYEGFTRVDRELKLHDFEDGTPTYSPDLANLFDWPVNKVDLNVRRALSAHPSLGDNYEAIAQIFAAQTDEVKRPALLLFMRVRMASNQAENTLNKLLKLDKLKDLAVHWQQAETDVRREPLTASIEALEAAAAYKDCDALLKKFPNGSVLEALTILFDNQRGGKQSELLTLLQNAKEKPERCDAYLYNQSFKVAALFGIFDQKLLNDLASTVDGANLAVRRALTKLFDQVLSITPETSNLLTPKHFTNLITLIEEMKKDKSEGQCDLLVENYCQLLSDDKIKFKHSKEGEYQTIRNLDALGQVLNYFGDYNQRLHTFLHGHILVPTKEEEESSLRPIVEFFQQLQRNATDLNEIEPLLSILEKTSSEKYWTCDYFASLLELLTPTEPNTPFPMELLESLLSKERFAAKDKKEAAKAPLKVPDDDVSKTLKAILQNKALNKKQQTLWCDWAVRELTSQKPSEKVSSIIEKINTDYLANAEDILHFLSADNKNLPGTEERIAQMETLLSLKPQTELCLADWNNTLATWLNELVGVNAPLVSQLLKEINDLPKMESSQKALLLHILAFSTVSKGLQSDAVYRTGLEKKGSKLITALSELNPADLGNLVNYYPQNPSPSAHDLLKIFKSMKKNESDLDSELAFFLKNPHPQVRSDFKHVAATRQDDLARMFVETRLIDGQTERALTWGEKTDLAAIFSTLKALELGTATVNQKIVRNMTQDELRRSVADLGHKQQLTHEERAQLWAMLFEGLGRTTGKYPHMAQQFSLIANDLFPASSRVLQLKTGEGKSHYVALRALRHVLNGKSVDIVTAKRSLAERDREDYHAFFQFFNKTSTYLDPKSSAKDYTEANIHYTTLGDLSLFLDEQASQGKPIHTDRDKYVGILDELDFILFDEGKKTQYNFANTQGTTPKKMMWFYEATNQFYKDVIRQENYKEIDNKVLDLYTAYLDKMAGDNEEKRLFLTTFKKDHLRQVMWLQSAYDTHTLKEGENFIVREKSVTIGDVSYPMKEVIPLSSDNQVMSGSTFSLGVHQLLAVRLNGETGKTKNHHVPRESHIVSSQVAQELIKSLWSTWEGTTGTVSPYQAYMLTHVFNGTQVLNVSTNRQDLRNWPDPVFKDNDEELMKLVVEKIKDCLTKNKSILFACKDDLHVKDLQETLEKQLEPKYFKQCIFYKNEDKKTVNTVLNDKKDIEAAHGAAMIAASGLGRGDNPDVAAVFLMDVNDANDQFQKGGRTGRNGEEGDVFQFYNSKKMLAQLDELKQQAVTLLDGNGKKLDEWLDKVPGDGNQKHFKQLLLLREYIALNDNLPNQAYRSALAQFSKWAMQVLSTVDDENRPLMRSHLISRINVIDQEWVDISSKDNGDDDKIRNIEKALASHAEALAKSFNEALKENPCTPPKIAHYFKLNESLPEFIPVKEDLSAPYHAAIASVLASLPVEQGEEEARAAIIKSVEEIKDLAQLKAFSERAAKASSISKLKLLCEQKFDIEPVKIDSKLPRLQRLRDSIYSEDEGNKKLAALIDLAKGNEEAVVRLFTRVENLMASIDLLNKKGKADFLDAAMLLMQDKNTKEFEKILSYSEHMSQQKDSLNKEKINRVWCSLASGALSGYEDSFLKSAKQWLTRLDIASHLHKKEIATNKDEINELYDRLINHVGSTFETRIFDDFTGVLQAHKEVKTMDLLMSYEQYLGAFLPEDKHLKNERLLTWYVDFITHNFGQKIQLDTLINSKTRLSMKTLVNAIEVTDYSPEQLVKLLTIANDKNKEAGFHAVCKTLLFINTLVGKEWGNKTLSLESDCFYELLKGVAENQALFSNEPELLKKLLSTAPELDRFCLEGLLGFITKSQDYPKVIELVIEKAKALGSERLLGLKDIATNVVQFFNATPEVFSKFLDKILVIEDKFLIQALLGFIDKFTDKASWVEETISMADSLIPDQLKSLAVFEEPIKTFFADNELFTPFMKNFVTCKETYLPVFAVIIAAQQFNNLKTLLVNQVMTWPSKEKLLALAGGLKDVGKFFNVDNTGLFALLVSQDINNEELAGVLGFIKMVQIINRKVVSDNKLYKELEEEGSIKEEEKEEEKTKLISPLITAAKGFPIKNLTSLTENLILVARFFDKNDLFASFLKKFKTLGSPNHLSSVPSLLKESTALHQIKETLISQVITWESAENISTLTSGMKKLGGFFNSNPPLFETLVAKTPSLKNEQDFKNLLNFIEDHQKYPNFLKAVIENANNPGTSLLMTLQALPENALNLLEQHDEMLKVFMSNISACKEERYISDLLAVTNTLHQHPTWINTLLAQITPKLADPLTALKNKAPDVQDFFASKKLFPTFMGQFITCSKTYKEVLDLVSVAKGFDSLKTTLINQIIQWPNQEILSALTEGLNNLGEFFNTDDSGLFDLLVNQNFNVQELTTVLRFITQSQAAEKKALIKPLIEAAKGFLIDKLVALTNKLDNIAGFFANNALFAEFLATLKKLPMDARVPAVLSLLEESNSFDNIKNTVISGIIKWDNVAHIHTFSTNLQDLGTFFNNKDNDKLFHALVNKAPSLTKKGQLQDLLTFIKKHQAYPNLLTSVITNADKPGISLLIKLETLPEQALNLLNIEANHGMLNAFMNNISACADANYISNLLAITNTLHLHPTWINTLFTKITPKLAEPLSALKNKASDVQDFFSSKKLFPTFLEQFALCKNTFNGVLDVISSAKDFNYLKTTIITKAINWPTEEKLKALAKGIKQVGGFFNVENTGLFELLVEQPITAKELTAVIDFIDKSQAAEKKPLIKPLIEAAKDFPIPKLVSLTDKLDNVASFFDKNALFAEFLASFKNFHLDTHIPVVLTLLEESKSLDDINKTTVIRDVIKWDNTVNMSTLGSSIKDLSGFFNANPSLFAALVKSVASIDLQTLLAFITANQAYPTFLELLIPDSKSNGVVNLMTLENRPAGSLQLLNANSKLATSFIKTIVEQPDSNYISTLLGFIDIYTSKPNWISSIFALETTLTEPQLKQLCDQETAKTIQSFFTDDKLAETFFANLKANNSNWISSFVKVLNASANCSALKNDLISFGMSLDSNKLDLLLEGCTDQWVFLNDNPSLFQTILLKAASLSDEDLCALLACIKAHPACRELLPTIIQYADTMGENNIGALTNELGKVYEYFIQEGNKDFFGLMLKASAGLSLSDVLEFIITVTTEDPKRDALIEPVLTYLKHSCGKLSNIAIFCHTQAYTHLTSEKGKDEFIQLLQIPEVSLAEEMLRFMNYSNNDDSLRSILFTNLNNLKQKTLSELLWASNAKSSYWPIFVKNEAFFKKLLFNIDGMSDDDSINYIKFFAATNISNLIEAVITIEKTIDLQRLVLLSEKSDFFIFFSQQIEFFKKIIQTNFDKKLFDAVLSYLNAYTSNDYRRVLVDNINQLDSEILQLLVSNLPVVTKHFSASQINTLISQTRSTDTVAGIFNFVAATQQPSLVNSLVAKANTLKLDNLVVLVKPEQVKLLEFFARKENQSNFETFIQNKTLTPEQIESMTKFVSVYDNSDLFGIILKVQDRLQTIPLNALINKKEALAFFLEHSDLFETFIQQEHNQEKSLAVLNFCAELQKHGLVTSHIKTYFAEAAGLSDKKLNELPSNFTSIMSYFEKDIKQFPLFCKKAEMDEVNVLADLISEFTTSSPELISNALNSKQSVTANRLKEIKQAFAHLKDSKELITCYIENFANLSNENLTTLATLAEHGKTSPRTFITLLKHMAMNPAKDRSFFEDFFNIGKLLESNEAIKDPLDDYLSKLLELNSDELKLFSTFFVANSADLVKLYGKETKSFASTINCLKQINTAKPDEKTILDGLKYFSNLSLWIVDNLEGNARLKSLQRLENFSLDKLEILHAILPSCKTKPKEVFLTHFYNQLSDYLIKKNLKDIPPVITKFNDYLSSNAPETTDLITGLFKFDHAINYNKERVELMHLLDQEKLLAEDTTIPGLWRKDNNDKLVQYGYENYANAFQGKAITEANKPQLLTIAHELHEIGLGKEVITHKAHQIQIKSDLKKTLSSYRSNLNSFWKTEQRKASAKTLDKEIIKATSYQDILNAIITARNEVTINDATKELNMHRKGNSRYYDTLNKLENTVITAWVNDKVAIGDFAAYVESYEKTLNETFKNYIAALTDKKFKHQKLLTGPFANLQSDTPIEKYDSAILEKLLSPDKSFPGYIQALSSEVKMRYDVIKTYQAIITAPQGGNHSL